MSISRFQKSPLRPPFSKPAFLVPETSVSGVDGRLKRKKKFRFYPDTYGRGLILAFIPILDCRCQEERRRYLI